MENEQLSSHPGCWISKEALKIAARPILAYKMKPIFNYINSLQWSDPKFQLASPEAEWYNLNLLFTLTGV